MTGYDRRYEIPTNPMQPGHPPAHPAGAQPYGGAYPGTHMPGYAPAGAYPAAAQQRGAAAYPAAAPKKRRRWIAVAAVLALVCLAAAVVLAFTLGQPKSDRDGALGQLDGKTPDEIQAELDRVVEDGMFNISIASAIEFADGSAMGDLRIENVPGNPYLMRVVIVDTASGQQIYETGVIEPNHHIQSDRLDVDLDAGMYECVAQFYALDPQTEDVVGQAAANVVISVLS